MDLGVSRTKAALLPGYMSLAQSAGKVILGKVATFPRTDKIIMYQVALLANCLATTTCPTITTYAGLVVYAVVFGLQDGCTSANNMLVVGDLVSKKQLSTGYSIFLVTSAASFLLGPPVAGRFFSIISNSFSSYLRANSVSANSAFPFRTIHFAFAGVVFETLLTLLLQTNWWQTGKILIFFISNHFIRNLHVEGQKIDGTCTTKDKIPKELSTSNIVITANN